MKPTYIIAKKAKKVIELGEFDIDQLTLDIKQGIKDLKLSTKCLRLGSNIIDQLTQAL